MRGLIVLFLVFISNCCLAGDTLFLRSIPLPDRAYNIDSDGGRLLIRLTKSVMLLEKGELTKMDVQAERRFSWFKNQPGVDHMAVYHTNIPNEAKIANKAEVENLIPGYHTSFITAARLGNYYYICYRGQVLEYLIQDMVGLRYRGISIRHIYCTDTFKVISTYDGIYKESELTGEIRKLTGTNYASGELWEHKGRIFLCQDGLYELQGDTNFVRISDEVDFGAFRKFFIWNNKVHCMFTNHISEFDPFQVAAGNTLVRSETFSDAAVWNERLYAGDSKGNLFIISKSGVTDTIRMSSAVWDLLPARDKLYVGCDSGLYVMDTTGHVAVVRKSLQAVQVACLDDDIFVSNFSGLYLLNKSNLYPIIQNVEFNHRALMLHKNKLYAGSIDGLYYIYVSEFKNDILPILEPVPLPEKETPVAPWKILVIIAATAVSVVFVYYLNRKNKTASDSVLQRPDEINPDIIEQIIRANEKVISVQSLAEVLDTSVVQLNRKLKPFGTTPLIAMQETKKKIAREMYEAGEPMENIARRTGYSPRYVREHFLNDSP